MSIFMLTSCLYIMYRLLCILCNVARCAASLHAVSFCCIHIHAGGKVYTGAHFGAGSGLIFLDDVQCTSSSDQLLECPSRPIMSHNCHHSDDAGVGCNGMFDLT